LRAVVVDRTAENEFLAVSQAPGVIGEEMSLDLFGGGSSLSLRVTVLESSPVILSGSVRHRLRLGMLRVDEPVVEPVEVETASNAAAETA
jgi:hypothetical protein